MITTAEQEIETCTKQSLSQGRGRNVAGRFFALSASSSLGFSPFIASPKIKSNPCLGPDRIHANMFCFIRAECSQILTFPWNILTNIQTNITA
jgi:hypothetical protein